MDIKDYNKEQFKNVCFVTGTATGGKTTISKALAEKYGFFRYDVDVEFDRHKALSNPIDQPYMNKEFKDADEFFLRDKDEYIDWLINNTKEQMEFILKDLVELSKNQKVVCDLHLNVDEARQIANTNQLVFLIREDNTNIIDDYINRKSHEGFKNFINSSTNPELAKENCNSVLRELNEKRCKDIRNSEYLYIERNANSTVEKTLELVERQFGLIK
ncbi:MAG: shikimate kinase [Lachnospiraceae bacterium]|nr:shikimate kinase [Lachnospiraceae bacterium]